MKNMEKEINVRNRQSLRKRYETYGVAFSKKMEKIKIKKDTGKGGNIHGV